MRPGERRLDGEAECLSAVAGVDVAETTVSVSAKPKARVAIVYSLPSALVRVVLPIEEVAVVPRGDDIAQPDADDLGRRVPSTHLLGHLLTQELGEGVGALGTLDFLGDGELGRRMRVQRDTKDGLG